MSDGRMQARLKANRKLKTLDLALSAIDYCDKNHIPAADVFAEMFKLVDKIDGFSREDDKLDMANMTDSERRHYDELLARRGFELMDIMAKAQAKITEEKAKRLVEHLEVQDAFSG